MKELPPASPGAPAPAAGTLEALYVQERHALTRFAYLLCGDLATAEDLVHDAFISLAPRLAGLNEPDQALGYVRVCILNAARRTHRRDTARTQRHLRLVEREATGPHDTYVIAEEHRRVARHVHALPARQRDVIALRYWTGMSEAQIAAALGITTGTVKSSASRALRTITAALTAEETS